MDRLELAERCEATTGPERNLDKRIAYRIGLEGWDYRPPKFTTYVDAALTLTRGHDSVGLKDGH